MKSKQQIIATRDDKGMILNEDLWPQWPLLPVKNRLDKDGTWPKMGVIMSGNPLVVILTNLFMFDPKAERIEYESVDALIAAGWIVD